MKRSEVMAEAEAIRAGGCRWRHRGRERHAADCIGFVQLIAKRFDIPFQDVTGYSRAPDGDMFLNHLKKYTKIAKGALKPAMIVVLRDPILPCHVGILTERHGQLRIVHCSLRAGRVVEEVWDKSFIKDFRIALEFPGIEDD